MPRLNSIERIETGQKAAVELAESLSAVQATLETQGIEFTNDDDVPGVRPHKPVKARDRRRAQKRAGVLL
jgi:hypothetical protein